MGRRWRLILADDEPTLLPENTEVEVLTGGVLRLVTRYGDDSLRKETYLAPGAWVEVTTHG